MLTMLLAGHQHLLQRAKEWGLHVGENQPERWLTRTWAAHGEDAQLPTCMMVLLHNLIMGDLSGPKVHLRQAGTPGKVVERMLGWVVESIY